MHRSSHLLSNVCVLPPLTLRLLLATLAVSSLPTLTLLCPFSAQLFVSVR